MAGEIVKGSSSDLASKLEPTVTSLARPLPDSLLQARADIQRSPDLQNLFREAKEKGHSAEWLSDSLAARLAGLWGNLPDALEASRYLADEFVQLGEGILIVSSQTGKAIARLDEKDLYTPAPVPRESGGLAQPLTRIEPGMEALIVSWVFEKGREERIEAILRERCHQTALLREEGDRRLWIATRTGRARLARSLSEDHPKTLLERAGGSSGAFLRHFDLCLEPPPEGGARRYRLEAKTALRVHDPTTTNLQYDRLNSMRGVMAQGWIRELGRQLSVDTPGEPQVWAVSKVTAAQVNSAEMWVADPEVMLTFLKAVSTKPILPVNGAQTTGLRGKVGTIVVPETFDTQNREIFGRWEVCGTLEVQVFIQDWTKLISVEVQGLAPHTEVVR